MTPTNTASTVDLFWWENSTVAVTIDALKAVGVAASAIGTHELDTGQADFEGRVIPATKYPLLSATGDPPAFGTIVKTVDANVDAIVSVHRHQAHNWQLAIPGTNRTRPVLHAGKHEKSHGHPSLSRPDHEGAAQHHV